MHPALSVIFFTVTSGTGYGLLVLLALSRIGGLLPELTPSQVLATGLFGLALVTAGLLSSTLHLANPKNAWRAFSRWRTSWLSREGILAILFYPVSLLWLYLEWTAPGSTAATVLSLLSAVIAVSIVLCTAMIYAQLKTIRQWNTAMTPLNYYLLAFAVGSLLLMSIALWQGHPVQLLGFVASVVLLAAAFAKIGYFIWLGKPAGPTINTALGFTRATVRLLDVGHTAGTFLTREFSVDIDRTRIIWMRILTILFGFVIPLLLLWSNWDDWGFASVALATLSAYLGVVAERWLFFAEARHVVTLYHGAQRT